MKHVDEWRDPALLHALTERLARRMTRPWTVLEVCGGQTHAFVRFGLLDLLPDGLRLVHGPGCPVCVTPLEVLERARRLARRPSTALCTYGDMLRVPGVHGDLLGARADGADVRLVASPLDVLRLARAEPARDFVFLAVGFETTAPTTAALVELADRERLPNVSVLGAHVRVPPALDALLGAPDANLDGVLAAGHVCTVEGLEDYEALAARHGRPLVVTGFEPVDLLHGLLVCVDRLERGEAGVENAYARVVRPEGNVLARAAVERVFRVADVPWRGFGVLREGGLAVRDASRDAVRRFALPTLTLEEPAECRAADVLRGRLRPTDCPAHGTRCTPEHPLGAPMVSSEGACAAYARAEVGSPA
ncbi:MAG: hydrogenase formation protein HypD [Sandaracinus sp.]|nr:hydrogenase formation protein HypD [Sandaracinus sp.]MCB9630992.1 hydrogenase formation protein HypD [Sandaracinus sp.]